MPLTLLERDGYQKSSIGWDARNAHFYRRFQRTDVSRYGIALKGFSAHLPYWTMDYLAMLQ